MCWNENITWMALGIGTLVNLFNIYHFSDTTLTLVSICLQWLLVMQLFESLAWRDQNNGKRNTFASNVALISHVTQPLLICMLFLTFSPAPQEFKIAALGISLAYISYVLYILNKSKEYTCLRPSKNGAIVDVYWWKNINIVIYCVALFAIILLLVRPVHLALYITGYLSLTLGMSILFYSCGAGSMWSCFTSFAPILITLFWKQIA